MRAAAGPSARSPRLLVVDPLTGRVELGRLADVLGPGDLVVVNDAATFPASLQGHDAVGNPIEVRLAGPPEVGWAVVFGRGDWHEDTDLRAPPPVLRPSDALWLGPIAATVIEVSARSPRLVRLRFDREGGALWAGIYAAGEPVRYRYLDRAWELEAFQNVYATRPWAAEMPSAGRALDAQGLLALKRAGVEVRSITHAAGLSATGDPLLDRQLPLPEPYDVPEATFRAALGARRVVAIGTTVVRALESAARGPLSGTTELLVGPTFEPQLVDGIVTNLHGPGESHFELLRAFADEALLHRAWAEAEAQGLYAHEFGDMMLVLEGALAAAARAA